MATPTLRSDEGVVIKLPGNNTEADFRATLSLAAQIIQDPSSTTRHHSMAIATVLNAWAQKAKVVS